MPTISVIVPVYKVESYIHRCVDSILAQTFADFELILVDDGSTDGCGAICDEYAAKDNRIHVIHQENSGLSAARNAGIDWTFANNSSEWLTFVDSDDWVHPKYLEVLLNGVKRTSSSVSVGGFERTKGKAPIVDDAALSATVWDTETYFCKHNTNATVAWGKLYRKQCFETIRYSVGKIHEDEFTTYKILFQFEKLAVISQPLYAYFQNENSIVGVAWNPKRIHAIEAYDERAQYFLEKHNPRMYQHTVQVMIWSLCNQIMEVKLMEAGIRNEYLPALEKLLHDRVKQYRTEFPLLTNLRIYRPLLGCYIPRTYRFFRRIVKHEQ